jgi:DNA-binding transcriptional regulator YbjK
MTREADPRGRLLDTALALIDSEGMRGLTHRKLEDAAGLARGSARYHLGTYDEIVAAALEHVVARETRMIEAAMTRLGRDALAGGTPSLPKMAAALVSALLEDPGTLRARYVLLLEASRRPSLRAEGQRWRAHFVDTTRSALAATGLDDPDTTAVLLVAVLDGLTLDAVITSRTTTSELAERAAAAILHTA